MDWQAGRREQARKLRDLTQRSLATPAQQARASPCPSAEGPTSCTDRAGTSDRLHAGRPSEPPTRRPPVERRPSRSPSWKGRRYPPGTHPVRSPTSAVSVCHQGRHVQRGREGLTSRPTPSWKAALPLRLIPTSRSQQLAPTQAHASVVAQGRI